jgi:dTDP-glucose 4,6-dehydratase
VGSHVLRHLLVNTDWQVVCPVTFNHKGLPARIASSVCGTEWTGRVDVVHWDLRTHADTLTRRSIGDVDVIMNVASESHVDRSISEPVPFVENNVSLMLRVLEFARVTRPRLFLHMSTDEVYGPAYGSQRHEEWAPVVPSNPYSASKAAQEAIAISYWRTYGVPLVITNTMNIIGEMQDPEKFLPMIVRSLRDRETIDIHVSPEGRPGSRHYLHARNLADAWLFLARWYALDGKAVPGYTDGAVRPARFNIVGDAEIHNDVLVRDVARIMHLDQSEVQRLMRPVSFHSSRPGHDLRYALDGRRLAALGWSAPVSYEKALERTVTWTLEHPEWLDI